MENIITPTKTGQVVKYHTPFPDEDPDQEYVVLEIDPPRALIQAIIPTHEGNSLMPTYRRPIEELTVVVR